MSSYYQIFSKSTGDCCKGGYDGAFSRCQLCGHKKGEKWEPPVKPQSLFQATGGQTMQIVVGSKVKILDALQTYRGGTRVATPSNFIGLVGIVQSIGSPWVDPKNNKKSGMFHVAVPISTHPEAFYEFELEVLP